MRPNLLAILVALVCMLAFDVARVKAQFKPWRIADRPTVSIGTVEDDERYTFSSISSLVRTADGRIVVAERTSTIRIFDRQGKFLSQFGRRGSGPGEFQFLNTIMPYRGDSIAAADFGLRRISIFDSHGKFGRSFQNPATAARNPGTIPAQSCCRVTMALQDGSFLVEPPEMLPNTPGPQRNGTLIILKLSADGTRLDTIAKVASRRISYDPGAPSRIRHVHLSWPYSYAAIGDLIYGGNGDQNALQIMGSDGRRLGSLALRQQRIPITRQVRQAFEDASRARYAENPRMFEGPLESYLAGEFASALPAFIRVRADPGGNLWLASARIPMSSTRQEYRVYSVTGAPLSQVSLPARASLAWVGRDEVILIESDELDVSYVRVYPLTR